MKTQAEEGDRQNKANDDRKKKTYAWQHGIKGD